MTGVRISKFYNNSMFFITRPISVSTARNLLVRFLVAGYGAYNVDLEYSINGRDWNGAAAPFVWSGTVEAYVNVPLFAKFIAFKCVVVLVEFTERKKKRRKKWS